MPRRVPPGRRARSTSSGTPLREVTFVVVDLETTGGSPADCGDHRGRRGQGPRRRGARRVPDPGQPRRADPAVHPGAHRHHRRDGRRRRRDRVGAARVPGVRRAAPCSSRTTRRSTSGSCAPRPQRHGPAVAARSGSSTPPAGPAGAACATRRPTAGSPRWPGVFRATHHAQPPRAGRRARDRRRPARADRAGRAPRAWTPSRSSRRTPRGSPRPAAAQAAPRRAVPHGPGVYLFEDARGPGALRRQVQGPAHPGALLLHRQRDAHAGWREMVGLAERVRRSPCPTALEAEVRELRLIAEHKPRYNRRSRFPERVLWLKLTVEPFPRLSLVREAEGRRRDLPGPVRVAARRRGRRWRRCTRRSRCASAPTGCPLQPHGAACALFGMGRCGGAVRRGTSPSQAYAVHAGRVRRDVRTATAAPCSDGSRSGSPGSPTPAVRGRRRAPRPARGVRCCAAARMQRLDGLARLPELVAARPTPAGGWEIVVVRHGRLAGHRRRGAAGVPPRPAVEALVDAAETGPARAGSDAAAPTPRRSTACCAGSTSPACGWSRWTGRGGRPRTAPGRSATGSRSCGPPTLSPRPGADRRRLRPIR